MISNKIRSCLKTLKVTLQVISEKGGVAKSDTGKSFFSQFIEIIALRYSYGKLSPDEYYQYCLYDDKRYTWDEKKRFFGRIMENGLIPILREQHWIAIAHDKLINYALLDGMGFPVPRVYAVYHGYRGYGSVPVLRTPDEVAQFVRNNPSRPFVAKPVQGMWGKNVWAVSSFDSDKQLLRMTNDDEVELNAFANQLDSLSKKESRAGVLLQQLLETHPDIREWCGERICSVRMVVIVDKRGARPISSLWKVATGSSMADNYWEPGNMVAGIDLETGRIDRPFTGLGRELRYVDEHPDTGKSLRGLILPDWSKLKDMCLAATTTMPGIAMQAWDIALTSTGPVFLEVNINGGMRLPQLVRQGGLYSGDFQNFLGNYNYP